MSNIAKRKGASPEVDERAAKITHKLLVNSSDEGTCWWREHLDLLPDVQAIVEVMLRLGEACRADGPPLATAANCTCTMERCSSCLELDSAIAAYDEAIKKYE